METIHADTETLSDEVRIWIYQANRLLNEQEVACISRKLEKWQEEWNTHGRSLYSEAWVEDQLFLILAVDESRQPASGCSIDQSVHFIRQIGSRINVDFFDRMNFAYQDEEGQRHVTTDKEISRLYDKGRITDDTLFYDTTLHTKGDWKEQNLIPLEDSWHRRFL